jgi:hypothetical protein
VRIAFYFFYFFAFFVSPFRNYRYLCSVKYYSIPI